MRALASTLGSWLGESHRFALAFVVRTSGSSPRPVGSAMAVREDGLIAGSVSGGCVEGAVVQASLRTLRTGEGELLEFGPESEAVLFEVGLSCGGGIAVWVAPAEVSLDAWRALFAHVEGRHGVELALSLEPSRPAAAVRFGGSIVGDSALFEVRDSVFRQVIEPAPRLVIVGAVHIAVALAAMAKKMGWETLVIDPRAAFAVSERFPDPPDRLIASWPEAALAEIALDERTYLVALTHDPKIDDEALALALRSPAAYVGALGGSKTQEKRRRTLLGKGMSEFELSRLHGPVGLEIGARTPEEIAVSILAEIIESRRGESP